MLNPFKLIRSTVFLLWLAASLALGAATFAVWALNLSLQVATLTTNAAAATVRHRRQLAKAVAKARLRRTLAAVPVVGSGMAITFEAQDFREWQKLNPGGTVADYSCEVAQLSAQVIDEALHELPEMARPSSDTVLAWTPECTH